MQNPQDVLAAIDRKGEQQDAHRLPPTKILSIDVTDGRGDQYTGKFLFTVPKLGDQVRIGKVKAVFLPNGTPDGPSTALVDMISFLTVTCTSVGDEELPTWFTNSMDLFDAAPLNKLFEEALDYERRFLNGDAVGGDDEGTNRGQDAPGGTGTSDVGRKIQPPAERRETLTGDGA